MIRHPISNKEILNQPFCVDDFGNMVFVCHYTKVYVSVDSAIFIGPVMPNVNGTYVCAQNAPDAFKESKSAFNGMDSNCNTCTYLERVQHTKSKAGFLYGRCKKDVTEHQYPAKDGVIMFHPEDYMGMECWEARP